MHVAPLAGAWIEMTGSGGYVDRTDFVAPLAGAWIEIGLTKERERETLMVAPLAGAWIEIAGRCQTDIAVVSRSPRGSVD